MVEFKKILCAVDLSEHSLRPLAYAAAIARWYGGRVTALHVVPSFEPMELAPTALFEPARIITPMPRQEVLARVGQALEAAGIPAGAADAAAEAGDPTTAVIDQVIAQRADLLVVGTHGRSGFDRLLLGSVAEKLLRKAPCPVLTVPPHAPASPPEGELPGPILCPVDFSPPSLQALGFALDIARRTHAPVTFVRVIEWLAEEEPRETARYSVQEFRRELLEDAAGRLKKLLADERTAGIAVRTKVVTGRAHHEILAVAEEEKPGLIVMGAQGHGALRAVFGSTSQQVVRAAACPVLTVRGVSTP